MKGTNILYRCKNPACGNSIRREAKRIGVEYFDSYYKGKRVDWFHLECYKKKNGKIIQKGEF